MKKALFTISLVVVLAAFVEVGASLYYFFVVPDKNRQMLEPLLGIAGQQRQITLLFKPHPYFNYVFNPEFRTKDGFGPYNSHGFRAPEWRRKDPGVVRIVAVGGSTTYGIFSRDGKDIWPWFLERKLNGAGEPAVEVLNLGVTGYTLFEVMGVMAMVVPELEPDIVLIDIGVNDAFAACYPEEGGFDNTRFRYSWTVRQLPGIVKAGMKRSYALRVAGLLTMSIDGYPPGDMMDAMQYPHPSDDEARRNAARATGRYFRRNLETVVAMTKRIGAVPVLFTQPLNPKWETVASPFYQGAVLSHQRINGIIREVAREEDVVMVDLYGGMRERELFVDAVHPNFAGEQLQADLIYPAVGTIASALQKSRGAGSSPQ